MYTQTLLTTGALALAGAVAIAPASAAKAHPSIVLVKVTPNAHTDHAGVTVKISGFVLYPKAIGKQPNATDGGHWHVVLDGKPDTVSADPKTALTSKIKDSGEKPHTVYVELENNDNTPLSPPVRSKTVSFKQG